MTVVTTHPDATVANGSSTVTGAASRHAALSDDSDSSYVTLPASGTEAQIGFAEPSIPSGAIYKGRVFRARVASPGGMATTYLTPAAHPGYTALSYAMSVTWSTPVTVSVTAGESYPPSGPPASLDPVNPITATLRATVNDARVYELFYDTTYIAVPVTNPTTPTGTVTDTNLPTAEWTNTLDSDGGAQTRYELKVYNDAEYGAGGFSPSTSDATYESGVTTGAVTSHAITEPLPSDTYRLYVRVAQTVNGSLHWSDWAYEAFVIDLDTPGDPDVTVTGEDNYGRIKVDIEATSGDATTDAFEIQKLQTDGETWKTIRTVEGSGILLPDDDDEAVAFDPEARNGTEESYRVRALHDYSGVYAASGWVEGSDTWETSRWWVKHPSQPVLNLPVIVHSEPGFSRAARQGIFQALGSDRAVVVDDTPGPKTGSIVFRFDTEAEQAAFDELFTAGVSLLVQAPPDHHWPDRWVRLANQERSRIIDKSYSEATFDTYSWTEVGRPTVDVLFWPFDYLLLSDSLLLGDDLFL